MNMENPKRKPNISTPKNAKAMKMPVNNLEQ